MPESQYHECEKREVSRDSDSVTELPRETSAALELLRKQLRNEREEALKRERLDADRKLQSALG